MHFGLRQLSLEVNKEIISSQSTNHCRRISNFIVDTVFFYVQTV